MGKKHNSNYVKKKKKSRFNLMIFSRMLTLEELERSRAPEESVDRKTISHGKT